MSDNDFQLEIPQDVLMKIISEYPDISIKTNTHLLNGKISINREESTVIIPLDFWCELYENARFDDGPVLLEKISNLAVGDLSINIVGLFFKKKNN